jgi:hypothetical protein
MIKVPSFVKRILPKRRLTVNHPVVSVRAQPKVRANQEKLLRFNELVHTLISLVRKYRATPGL